MSVQASPLATEFLQSISAQLGRKIAEQFKTIATQSLAGNENGLRTLPVISQWLDQAIQQVAGNCATLQIPVTGVGASPANSGLQGGFAAPPPQAQTGGFLPNNHPMAAAFGAAPLPGGASSMFAQQPAFSGVPAGNAAPEGGVRALSDFGQRPYRIPNGNAAYIAANSANPPACGIGYKKNNVSGYCAANATVDGKCGTMTCGGHKTRTTVEQRGEGKKSDSKSGGAAIAANQLQGLRQPTNVPAAFANNPAASNHLAQVMGQAPQMNPFGQVPPAGGFGAAIQNPSSMAMSQQLMNSVQNQVGGIPQQQGVAPSGAGINLAQAMQSQGANAVNIPQNGGFGGFQFPPAQPSGQIAPSKSVFEDDDGEGSSSDDDSDGEATSTPIPQTDHNAFLQAMAAAQQPAPQAAASPFGGQAVQQQPAPPAATPNPLAAVMAAAQQPAPQAAASPFGAQAFQQQPAAQAPPAQAAPTDVGALFGAPSAGGVNPLATAMAAATQGK